MDLYDLTSVSIWQYIHLIHWHMSIILDYKTEIVGSPEYTMCPPSCAIGRMKVNLDSKSQEIAQMKVKTNLFSNETKTIKTQRKMRSIWLVRTHCGRIQIRYCRPKLFYTQAHRVKHYQHFVSNQQNVAVGLRPAL